MTLPYQFRRRILLADDDREVRLGVADFLSSGLGLEVLQAETGLEALELARLNRIHAALLDLQMPGCTGLEALPRLREEREGLPCIVYSGSLTANIEHRLLEAGAMAVLAKPVRPDQLREEVERAIAQSPFPPLDSDPGTRGRN